MKRMSDELIRLQKSQERENIEAKSLEVSFNPRQRPAVESKAGKWFRMINVKMKLLMAVIYDLKLVKPLNSEHDEFSVKLCFNNFHLCYVKKNRSCNN